MANDTTKPILRLIRLLGKDKLKVYLSFVFALFYSITQVAGPVLLGQSITVFAKGMTKVIKNNQPFPFNQLMFYIALCGGAYIFNWIFLLLQNYVLIDVTQKMVLRIRLEISEKMAKLPLSFYENHLYGDILSTLTNDVNVLSLNFRTFLIQIADAPIYLLMMIVVMFYRSPILAVVVILSVPVSALSSKLVLSKSQQYFDAQQKTLGELNGIVEENYTGFDVVKLFGHEEEDEAIFRETNRKLSKASEKALFRSYLLAPIVMLVGHIAHIAVLILGAFLTFLGKIPIGDVQTFLNFVNSISEPMQQIARLGSVYQSFIAAASRVFAFVDEEEEKDTSVEGVKAENMNVSFDNISFGYLKDKIVINNFSFDVKEGEHIAIVGPTGAGKTTLIKLLMRFYDVLKGQILLGNVPITDFNRDTLHELIGIVPQEIWFFQGTIADNLRLGREDATDEEIEVALEEVGADYFVDLLPGGINFVLAENGANISAGQRQLLAIARAFIANRSILVLDEATSCVDTQTERRLQDAMIKLMEGKTTFIIAHRLSTIVDADKILYLQDGDVKEHGTHEQLMKLRGLYRKMFDSQYT
ncbi:ABC transporter ATP-binding protein [Pseudobutyrivibrio ruminis]|uniref:Multidrug ABC transporter ATP-binding protein n=1 Tax=Pseudobutyrivibrio ruminis TaxID=46206 RepID=A0A2G3DV66_9FIRM|nr:ABC transporter ATP-binding protein [Pseudobutyrivibrio ruminis]PHU34928.1 multidrug ABC transporter ATP-binding protein [Pseudobutyrivibrio ruminis]